MLMRPTREVKDKSLLKKFEAELDVVKEMAAKETETLAEVHTLRSLTRKRSVATSLLWPKELVARKAAIEKDIGKSLDGEKEKARANVIARLYGSNPAKEATAEVVRAVVKIMGPSKERREDATTTQRGAAEVEGQEEQQEESEQNSGSDRPTELSDGDRIVEESEEFQGFSDPVEPLSEDELHSGSEGAPNDDENDIDPWERLMDPEADDFAEFEERIGASDDDEDTDEDEAGRDELERTDDDWSGSEADDQEDKEEELGDAEEPKSADPDSKGSRKRSTERLSKPVKKKALSEKNPASSASSQFLPTLMSGYVSGGDSDPDAEYYKNKKRAPPEKAVRKNRMGQQARRALWEKKFGGEANHIKKEAEKIREKRETKTAKGARGGRGGVGGRGGTAARGEVRSNRLPGRPQEKKDEGPLHPSWEAAKKAKEKQVQMQAAMFKPQGKKITFD
jgi:hypothetical protein